MKVPMIQYAYHPAPASKESHEVRTPGNGDSWGSREGKGASEIHVGVPHSLLHYVWPQAVINLSQ